MTLYLFSFNFLTLLLMNYSAWFIFRQEHHYIYFYTFFSSCFHNHPKYTETSAYITNFPFFPSRKILISNVHKRFPHMYFIICVGLFGSWVVLLCKKTRILVSPFVKPSFPEECQHGGDTQGNPPTHGVRSTFRKAGMVDGNL